MSLVLTCPKCPAKWEAWDEGHPYYLSSPREQAGSPVKIYVYHPDPERSRAKHYDTDTICLDCAQEFKNDSAAPSTKCPKCQSGRIKEIFNLGGEACPKCHKGLLKGQMGAIS